MLSENILSTLRYVVDFLLGEKSKDFTDYVFYGLPETAPSQAKIIIVPSVFFDEGVYGTPATLPKTPFEMLPDSETPFLFGEPRLEKDEKGRLVLYADIVASAYFMLSRYEETVKPECRDQYGRFLAKDSVVFQQGFGMRPLVDEWGRYLRDLLRKAGVGLPSEKCGFSKIYLTHDVDAPFVLRSRIHVFKQMIKNIIHRGVKILHPYRVFRTGNGDPYNNFSKIIEYDTGLQGKIGKDIVRPIYFIIAADNRRSRIYSDIELPKFRNLLAQLESSNAEIGFHASFEAGGNPALLKGEMERMFRFCRSATTKSRHHYLRWREPEHIDEMEAAGITDDFTLGYADCAGFRSGTCRPYRFINPKTLRVSNVVMHPMEIMECSLDRKVYMGLDSEAAENVCRTIINEVRKYDGELNILWHNNSFLQGYLDRLYNVILEYLAGL